MRWILNAGTAWRPFRADPDAIYKETGTAETRPAVSAPVLVLDHDGVTVSEMHIYMERQQRKRKRKRRDGFGGS